VAPCVRRARSSRTCRSTPGSLRKATTIGAGSDPGAKSLARYHRPCLHGLCQTRCTRNDYEETVAIRALKRIAEERGRALRASRKTPGGCRVAIVGSGPSGLAAAAFLP